MTVDNRQIQRILVIKLSALGDFVLSFRSFEALRKNFPDTHITLLTTKPFKRLAEASNWFDAVHIDERPRVGQVHQLLKLRRAMINANYDLVVDLQGNDRTSMYYHMMIPHQPTWSGVARGCAYFHSRKAQKKWHPVDREAAQLNQMGIEVADKSDVKWLGQAIGGKNYRIDQQTILFAAGCSSSHLEKRWPVEEYAKVARVLIKRGWHVVLVGTKEDADVNFNIKNLAPDVRDFTGKTNLLELAAFGYQAGFALGNDTGPMHLLACCGCPSLVLFGSGKGPSGAAPRGQHVHTLHEADISSIDSKAVLKILGKPVSTSTAV